MKKKVRLRSLTVKKKSDKTTVVKGVRAKQSFWDNCDLVAKKENIDRNKLIVREVGNYISQNNGVVDEK